MSELHLITAISNPLRFRSRYRLYEEFKHRMLSEGALLYTIESAFEDQDFLVTKNGNDRHFQVRSRHLFWSRENLINVALRRLPPDWKYMAWVDADIAFTRPGWVKETLNQLKNHAFVQMFAHVIDLGPNYEPLNIYEGFAYRRHLQELANEVSQPSTGSQPSVPNKDYGQTGFAWAARREALEAV
jgi:hypothetical protein